VRDNGIYPVSFKAIKKCDHMICHICGKKIAEEDLSFDHLIPIAHGGPHAEWNLAVAHLECNQKRGPGRIPAQLRLPVAIEA